MAEWKQAVPPLIVSWSMAAIAMLLLPGAMPGVPCFAIHFQQSLFTIHWLSAMATDYMSIMLRQIYEHGRGLAFHFDKDEHLLKEEGTMVHPIVNSIIYLTGNRAESRQGMERTLKVWNASLATFSCAQSIAGRKGEEQFQYKSLEQA